MLPGTATSGTLSASLDFATKEVLEPVSFTSYVYASVNVAGGSAWYVASQL